MFSSTSMQHGLHATLHQARAPLPRTSSHVLSSTSMQYDMHHRYLCAWSMTIGHAWRGVLQACRHGMTTQAWHGVLQGGHQH